MLWKHFFQQRRIFKTRTFSIRIVFLSVNLIKEIIREIWLYVVNQKLPNWRNTILILFLPHAHSNACVKQAGFLASLSQAWNFFKKISNASLQCDKLVHVWFNSMNGLFIYLYVCLARGKYCWVSYWKRENGQWDRWIEVNKLVFFITWATL